MELYNRILKLRPNVDPSDFDLQDNSDGNGPFISRWDSVETQPSEADIANEDDTAPVSVTARIEIARLEAEITNRRLREASADTAAGNSAGRQWLKTQDALIAIERAKL